MIRLVSGAVGVVTAGMAAFVEAAGGYPSPAVVWPVGTGLLCAAMTYGVLTNRVKTAHDRIDAEKLDRVAAIADLKADVNRGFERIDTALERQTATVLDALSRQKGQK